ncbi:MAG: polysaccharide biosynthesis tyrosine autokinase [Beijerinckiaceae bacterium]|nr:polysaccharide biosynthesis tyrosine autokinase [Beijerinckiaceae bacterium]
MNYQRLPPGGRQTLPAVQDNSRSLDVAYRGAEWTEPEVRATPLRAMLVRYLHLAFKYKGLIALCCAATLLAGLVITYMTPKVYSASTTVKIDRAVPKVLNNQSSADAGLDPQFYQTQFELIKSRALAERVAIALNLGQTDFLEGAERGSLFARMFGGGTPERDAALIAQRQSNAVDKIMEGLAVQPVALSSIVRIRFSSTEPRWAQRISTGVAEQFERFTLDRRFSASNHARAFLDERLQQLKIKLQDSERQLVEYAQKNGIVNVDDKRPESLANLQAVQNALAEAGTARLKREQLWEQAQINQGMSLPQVLTDPIIQSARQRAAALQATYQEKLNVLRPAFPEMVALRSQIIEAERQIRTQISFIRDSIRVEFENARAQESALAAKLELVKEEVLDIRGRSIEYTILTREVDTARSLYDGVLQQFRELGVAGDVDMNNVSIVDRAQLPRAHDSPSLRINLIIALLFGLVGAAGAIAVREALDDTFKTPDDIEDGLNLIVLGISPVFTPSEMALLPFQSVQKDVTSPIAEAYRSLRTALQFSTEEGAPKTLLVTSSRPGEGKSTTAASLAYNFAQLGMKVLLVDADLRNPSMHRVLGVENGAGLSNYLIGAAEASEVSKESGVAGLTVMTTGPLPPNPAELLAGPRFASLLTVASDNFDIVIIDGPPVMGLADSTIIGSLAAGTLLVVESGGARRAVVRDAVKRLDFARARILGVLLSKFDPQKSGFTYGYGGYSYTYGSQAYFDYGKKISPPGDKQGESKSAA